MEGQLPWWAGARFRLALLVAMLAVVGAAWLHAAPSQPAAADGCWIHEGPQALELRASVVTGAVRRLRLAALAVRGTPDVEGAATPNAAWSDTPPHPSDLRGVPDPIVPAGYQLLWWSTTHAHLGVAAFRFADPADAATFVADAASTSCRPATVELPVAGIPGARGLSRRNPLGFLQADIFFSRGATGYWLLDVPAGQPRPILRGSAASAALHTIGRLACELRQARCEFAMIRP